MTKTTNPTSANSTPANKSKKTEKLTYTASGVNIDVGDQFIEKIKPLAKSTFRKEVLTGIGGFGSLCAIPAKYKNPILVSGTDGIGTKLKFALEIDVLETLGIDLVAMCVNDVLTQGAQPLFFLDYYACGKLKLDDGVRLISGVADGCRQAGCALIGGETAEMPGLYDGRDFDMAGFTVGVVDKKQIITGKKIKKGDVLIGVNSSGVHSNGFSLVRKIFENNPQALKQKISKQKISDLLIAPTKIYVKSILSLIKKVEVKGIAHITGGGLVGNVPRMFGDKLMAVLHPNQWQKSELFDWLQDNGNVDEKEMYKVFNMGIGMVIAVSPKQAEKVIKNLQKNGEVAQIIGTIESRKVKSDDCVINY